MKKYFFIIVCVFILVLGVAVYVEYTSNEIQKIQEGIGQDKINNSSVSSNGEKLNQESVTSYAMPIDCGNIIFVEKQIKQPGASFIKAVPADEDDAIKKERCFQEKFKICELATLNIVSGGNEFRYEIIGKHNARCAIKQTEIKSTESSLIEKSMVCLYNATQTFSDFERVYINDSCSGSLFDFLKNFNLE